MKSQSPVFNPLSSNDVDALCDRIESATSGEHSLEFTSTPLFHRKLGIAVGKGNPTPELTTATTFGLSHEDWTDVGFKARTELVTTWKGDEPTFTNALATIARACIINRIPPFSGVVFSDAFSSSGIPSFGNRMPHGLGLQPYMWADGRFSPLKLSKHTVWFVQIVPIFEAEKRYLGTHGLDAFENILEVDGAQFYLSTRGPHC